MNELTKHDLRFVVTRLPRDVRDLLSAHPSRLFVGGGFIRAVVAGETPSDIDLFGSDRAVLDAAAATLKAQRQGARLHNSQNAITLLSDNRMPVQFITRWTFERAFDLVNSFDFTVCQAAIYRGGSQSNAPWRSQIGRGFYVDLAGRRLVYTHPVRDEEAGGSMLRVLKYVRRGYSIQVTSLGGVIARMAARVRDSHATSDEAKLSQVFAGLLREVDPLLIVDGMDVVDDHEPLEGADADALDS